MGMHHRGNPTWPSEANGTNWIAVAEHGGSKLASRHYSPIHGVSAQQSSLALSVRVTARSGTYD